MNTEKYGAAERILDAIGALDDRIIAECADAPRKIVYGRKKFAPIKKIAVIAAVLGVAASLLLAMLAVGMFNDSKSEGAEDCEFATEAKAENINDAGTAGSTSSQSLEGALVMCKPYTEDMKKDFEDIDLDNGIPKIIIKYSYEEAYRVCNVTVGDMARLTDLLYPSGKAQTRDGASNMDGVWLCLADGSVITPEIPISEQSAAVYGLFEYEKSYEPSAEFVSALIEVIKNNCEWES